MSTGTATANPAGNSQLFPPQIEVTTSNLMNTMSLHHQTRATTSDVLVTPSSSTSVRKRSFLDSTEPQLNDPGFRTSCKKRFLQMRENSNEAYMQTPQRSIDVLRDVVRDELIKFRDEVLQSKNQDQSQCRNKAHTTAADAYHEELNSEANADCGDTTMAHYNHESTGLQPRRVNTLPCANHYIGDDELYDLLLEMEQELNGTVASNGNYFESDKMQTELLYAGESSVAVMTEWEEEMYHMSACRHEDDAVQEQIMDYYNQN